jgi:hypothetical protein
MNLTSIQQTLNLILAPRSISTYSQDVVFIPPIKKQKQERTTVVHRLWLLQVEQGLAVGDLMLGCGLRLEKDSRTGDAAVYRGYRWFLH